jgi:hypothetical protein
VIESDEEQGRDLSRLVVSRAGRLAVTGDAHEPYRIVGPGGEVVEPVSVFLRDLLASGKSESTLRSYSVDLLRWWRFLGAVGVEWDRASRVEARGFQLLDPADCQAAAADVPAAEGPPGLAGSGSAEPGDRQAGVRRRLCAVHGGA